MKIGTRVKINVNKLLSWRNIKEQPLNVVGEVVGYAPRSVSNKPVVFVQFENETTLYGVFELTEVEPIILTVQVERK